MYIFLSFLNESSPPVLGVVYQKKKKCRSRIIDFDSINKSCSCHHVIEYLTTKHYLLLINMNSNLN